MLNAQLFAPTTVIGRASCSTIGDPADSPAAITSTPNSVVLDGGFSITAVTFIGRLPSSSSVSPIGSGLPKYFSANLRVSTRVSGSPSAPFNVPATTGKRSTSNTFGSAQVITSLNSCSSRLKKVLLRTSRVTASNCGKSALTQLPTSDGLLSFMLPSGQRTEIK